MKEIKKNREDSLSPKPSINKFMWAYLTIRLLGFGILILPTAIIGSEGKNIKEVWSRKLKVKMFSGPLVQEDSSGIVIFTGYALYRVSKDGAFENITRIPADYRLDMPIGFYFSYRTNKLFALVASDARRYQGGVLYEYDIQKNEIEEILHIPDIRLIDDRYIDFEFRDNVFRIVYLFRNSVYFYHVNLLSRD